MSDALLVMVHGTPRPESNAEMFLVVEEVKNRGIYPMVLVGFMECNEPSIPSAIAQCIADGATSVVAVPYFLHTGTHVADDLPTLLEDAKALYPDVKFTMGRYIGPSPRITEILTERGLSV